MDKMKDDLISRQAAIDGKISIQLANGVEIYSDEAVLVDYLRALPTVDPMKHGKWKPYYEILEETSDYFVSASGYECSECGTIFHNQWDFCGNCGAVMEKADEN